MARPARAPMNDTDIDRILDNLAAALPVMHRRLLRMDLGGVTAGLTRLHLGIMGMLRDGSMTVSELARISFVPRPQMTHLLDQLVKSGIVERHPDSVDRRVVNVALTDRGVQMLRDVKRKVEEDLKNRLSGLTSEDLAAMAEALETLNRIVARL
jgi:DNA-binding MarR family transcriptional regulator